MTNYDLITEAPVLWTKTDVEMVTRPMIRMVRLASQRILGGEGFDSVFLTRVDTDNDGMPIAQCVLVADNSSAPGAFFVPEDLWVHWSDARCRMMYVGAKDMGPRWVDNFQERFPHFGDLDKYNVQTYVVISMRRDDGTLTGTICAGSSKRFAPDPDVELMLKLAAHASLAAVQREIALRGNQLLLHRVLHPGQPSPAEYNHDRRLAE